MEAQGNLRLLDAIGLEVIHHRQRAATRQVAIGQTVATVIRMPVELDVIDRRVRLHERQHLLQPHFRRRIQVDASTREAHGGLLDLVIIVRQQFGHAVLILSIGRAETDRQHPHLGHPAIRRVVANHRTATVHQSADQPPGLYLRAIEEHFTTAESYRAQVDIPAPRLPGRSRCQQGRRAARQHGVVSLQAKRRLLARPPHELCAAEIGNRLSQAALEFIAFDLPLNALQACLESECHGRKAGEHTEQG